MEISVNTSFRVMKDDDSYIVEVVSVLGMFGQESTQTIDYDFSQNDYTDDEMLRAAPQFAEAIHNVLSQAAQFMSDGFNMYLLSAATGADRYVQ